MAPRRQLARDSLTESCSSWAENYQSESARMLAELSDRNLRDTTIATQLSPLWSSATPAAASATPDQLYASSPSSYESAEYSIPTFSSHPAPHLGDPPFSPPHPGLAQIARGQNATYPPLAAPALCLPERHVPPPRSTRKLVPCPRRATTKRRRRWGCATGSASRTLCDGAVCHPVGLMEDRGLVCARRCVASEGGDV